MVEYASLIAHNASMAFGSLARDLQARATPLNIGLVVLGLLTLWLLKGLLFPRRP